MFADYKNCQKCRKDKPLSAYGQDKRRKDGLKYRCYECVTSYEKEYKLRNPELTKLRRQASHIKHQYGMTMEEYNFKLETQNYKCAICGSDSTNNSLYKSMIVDHNHNTGQVRGLLCHPCNATIGYAKEDIDRLLKCADYLLRYK